MGKAKNTKTKVNASSSTNDPDELKVSVLSPMAAVLEVVAKFEIFWLKLMTF